MAEETTTATTTNATIIGSAADGTGVFSLQPKQAAATNGSGKVISDPLINYGAPSWVDSDTPGTLTDAQKAKRTGDQNAWQDRVLAPSSSSNDTEEAKLTDYKYRNDSNSNNGSNFDEGLKLLGKGAAEHYNRTSDDKSPSTGPAWAASKAVSMYR